MKSIRQLIQEHLDVNLTEAGTVEATKPLSIFRKGKIVGTAAIYREVDDNRVTISASNDEAQSPSDLREFAKALHELAQALTEEGLAAEVDHFFTP